MKARWCLLLLALCFEALAQTYPAKTVRMIVPFPAGGGSDFIARQISAKLSENLGQQFVIDNRGGAGGMIGAELLAKAPRDGHTLMITSASFSSSAATNKPAFDPINTIIPVIEIGISPFVLILHPSVPATDLKQLIAIARARPGQIFYGSSGIGGFTHLATELMSSMAKIKLVHVPYKGAAPALTDLLGGQIHFTFVAYSTAESSIKSGRVRPLAITSRERNKMLPQVQTIGETVPGYDVGLWYGVLAPRGTPPQVIERLNETLNRILQEPEMRRHIDAQGMTPSGGTAAAFGARVRADYDAWVKIVREADIKPE